MSDDQQPPFAVVKLQTRANELNAMTADIPASELLPTLNRRLHRTVDDVRGTDPATLTGEWSSCPGGLLNKADRALSRYIYHVDVTSRTLERHRQALRLAGQARQHVYDDEVAARFLDVSTHSIGSSCREIEQRLLFLADIISSIELIKSAAADLGRRVNME